MNTSLIFIFIILLLEIPPASSYTPNEIEWAPAIEATLYKGNNLTNGPYTVLALQFPAPVPGFKNFKNEIVPETPVNPMVYLNIYKNSELIKDIVLTPQSASETDPDYEFKVSLTDIIPGTSRDWVDTYYNPWAKVSLSLRGKPGLEVKVTTDKTDYVSNNDDILTVTVEVKNTGDAIARDVEIDLNPGVLKLRGGSTGQFHKTYQELKKSETQTFEVVLIVPKASVNMTYLLTADAKAYDVKNIEYKSSGSLAVPVSSNSFSGISVSKSVKKIMYLKDIAVIRVAVSNGGVFDAYNVRLTDSLNENFELLFDSPMHWEIPLIKSGQDWSVTYSLKPLETNLNGFTIPAANALFTINSIEYNASSDSASIIVNGPKIILNKTVDKQTVNVSEDITITVSAKNVGNIPTKTQIVDYLPDNVSLVGGQTSIESIFLEVNKPQGFSYVIRPKMDGNIELPSVVANYISIEYRGTVRQELSSNRTVITVIDPNKINSSSDTFSTSSDSPLTDGQIPVTLPDTIENTPDRIPENAPEITPAPIAPFIDTALTICLLIFAVFLRRK